MKTRLRHQQDGYHSRHIEYPDDVKRLRRKIPELASLTDHDIQDLYHTWSEDCYCASWLIFDSFNDPQEFRSWLLEEVEFFTAERYN
jgi:hypothetical protein